MAKLSRTQRNWLWLVIVGITLAVGAYAVQYRGLYDIAGAVGKISLSPAGQSCVTCGQGLTGGDVIEALASEVDVLGYAVGCAECGDVTPAIRIGLVNYGTSREEMPKHIRLTDKGYVVVEESLDWKPGRVESNEQKLCWDYAKYEYYKENGMLLPEQSGPILEALEEVYDEYSDAATHRLLYAVFVAATRETGEWNRIVLELLYGVPYRHLTSGGVQAGIKLYVGRRVTIHKVGRRTATADGKEVSVEWQPHMAIPAQGRFTEADWDHLVESGQMQIGGGWHPLFGPEEYTGAINHPWQGRELKR